jgi:hypothetical protein
MASKIGGTSTIRRQGTNFNKDKKKESKKMSFDSLPNELLEHIFRMSDVPYFILRQVCRRWKTIVIANAMRVSLDVLPANRVWCYHCLSGGSMLRKHDSYRLCSYCKMKCAYRRICLTTAKKSLHLTDKDMSHFTEVAFAPNPHGRSRSPMRIYDFAPLEHYALIKHKKKKPKYVEEIHALHHQYEEEGTKPILPQTYFQ